MSRGMQYLREAQLIFTDDATRGLVLPGDLHFVFRVSSYTVMTPNQLDVRCYGLGDDALQQIEGEFTRIILNAGYVDSSGTIFDGTIVQVRRGWEENAAQRYIDITALDGDPIISYQLINVAAPAGGSYADRWAAVASALGLPITAFPTEEQLPQELQGRLPRGWVRFGAARDAARDLAAHGECNWSIQQGKLVVTPEVGDAVGEVVEINGMTGMIGWPEQTDEGVIAKVLLNSRLACNGRVRINNKDVIQQALDTNLDQGEGLGLKNVPGVQGGRAIIPPGDGQYRIVELSHTGDTRGTDWYTELLCLADDPNQQIPQRLVSKGVS